MSNIFVDKFRKELILLQTAIQNTEGEKAENARIFSASVANEYNASLESTKQEKAQKTKKNLTSQMNKLSLRLNQFSTFQPEQLKDSVLFNDSFQYSINQIKNYLAIYKNNYAMKMVIKAYCQRNDLSVYIPEVQEIAAGYERFYNSAMKLCDNLVSNPYLDLDMYANPDFCSDLFEIIGTGEELRDHWALNYAVTEPLKNYEVTETDNNAFGFNFKPVWSY